MNIFFLSFISYFAGILTFLAPCTLPILPVYLTMCMKQNFRSLTTHTFYLFLGVALVYVILGVFAGSIGSLLTLHKLFVLKLTGVLLLIIGVLTLFGISFTKGLPLQKNFSPAATILYGTLFAVAWSGCIGPILGGILLLAGATQTALAGAWLLLIYGLGMMTPLFIISIIADRKAKLPKLWRILYGKTVTWSFGKKTFTFHTTNLVTGVLFIALGLFFLFNGGALIGKLFPSGTDWIFSLEDKLQLWVIS